MQQYARFKQQHPDCVLFFRMGDFYEMFDDDAVTAHRALGLTLTQRTEGVPMAGVPHHALEGYLRRMIEQGYRVAVCEQIQDPKDAKGVVNRAVARVLTPGTLVDEALLEETQPNQVAAIQFIESGDAAAAVLALAEISTGRFTLVDLAADSARDEVARLRPTELLFVETADGVTPRRIERLREICQCALTPRPSWTFRRRDALDLLFNHYHVTTLSGFGLADDDPAVGAAGALLHYLRETQPDAGGTNEPLRHLRPPKREHAGASLILDATTLASLEIERTMRTGGTEGSLLATLQRCATPMGKRLLRQWLCFPLCDRDAIESRQDVVAHFLDDRALANELGKEIARVQDVARIAGRVSMMRASPRDLVALGGSVSRLETIATLLAGRAPLGEHATRLNGLVESLTPVANAILERCVDAPPAHLREGGLFRGGCDSELDEARLLQRDANSWLAAYQKRLIEQSAIPSLKIGYNKVFGYYIEVTHTHTAKVPETFSRKQTLKNAERYITPELKEFEDKVTTAEARAIEREKKLFERLCRQAAAQTAALAEYADAVAELDVLLSFAEIAQRWNFVRPRIDDEAVLDIRAGRHPVLDRTLSERFVPNDCALGVRETQETSEPDGADLPITRSFSLITGPNMAGKSTFIRQVAIITLLAHTGCYVPAESATIGLTDRIFTRIGASDELHAGQSTFMVEMTETANILHHATDRSLVILDEIGRGTSTLDGLALAWAIAETIASINCRALFATHYHELTSLADRLPNINNLHVAVREWGEEIIFLYRILPGRTDRSYGIHVARIAGLPQSTIDRAKEVLESLAVHTTSSEIPAPQTAARSCSGQLDLFTEYVDHPVVDELRAIEVDHLSPMEAFDRLRKLIEAVEPGDRKRAGR